MNKIFLEANNLKKSYEHVNGSITLFGDWSGVTSGIKCFKLGLYDVYLENPCDKWDRKFVYGKILLYLSSDLSNSPSK